MWSDAARQASAEARKKGAAHGHNAGQGNRKVAKHIKDQHKETFGHKATRYALTAAVAPAAAVAFPLIAAARGVQRLMKRNKKG